MFDLDLMTSNNVTRFWFTRSCALKLGAEAPEFTRGLYQIVKDRNHSQNENDFSHLEK